MTLPRKKCVNKLLCAILGLHRPLRAQGWWRGSLVFLWRFKQALKLLKTLALELSHYFFESWLFLLCNICTCGEFDVGVGPPCWKEGVYTPWPAAARCVQHLEGVLCVELEGTAVPHVPAGGLALDRKSVSCGLLASPNQWVKQFWFLLYERFNIRCSHPGDRGLGRAVSSLVNFL